MNRDEKDYKHCKSIDPLEPIDFIKRNKCIQLIRTCYTNTQPKLIPNNIIAINLPPSLINLPGKLKANFTIHILNLGNTKKTL